MKKIGDLTNTANQAGEFQEGSAAAGIQPTLLKADWFNSVQRELVAVISAADIVQDPAKDDQLQSAIKKLATAAVPAKAAEQDFIDGTDDVKFTTVKKIRTWFGSVLKQATESAFGWAKVATQSQANSGVDDATMVTPKKLCAAIAALVIQATETIAGIAKFATQDQVDTGTAADLIVNPKTLKAALLKQSIAMPSSFTNLKLSTTGASALVSISADEIVLKDSTGKGYIAQAASATVNLAASGANGLDTGIVAASTWYSVWLIWNGSALAAICSASMSAPTLPAGYTFKGLIGFVVTDATASKYPLGIMQRDDLVQYTVGAANVPILPALASGAAGSVSGGTTVAVALGRYLPPSAKTIIGQLAQGTQNVQAMVAPNASYGGGSASGLYINGYSGETPPTVQFEFLLESMSIYWASSGSGGRLNVFGWRNAI